MKSGASALSRAARWAALLLLLTSLAGLTLFMLAGTNSRLWADDYCYSGFLSGRGFWQAQVDWWQTGGNRFATLPLVAASDLLGVYAPAYLPTLLLILLFAGFACLLAVLFRAGWLFSLVSAAVFTYFLAFLAPDRIQTIYWRMGGLHYTFPLALLAFNLALGLHAWRGWRGWRALIVGLLGLLLAFFAAGSSETFAAAQTALFGLLLLGALVGLKGAPRKAAGWRLLLLLAGSLAAMGLMLASPSNAWRQAALPPPESVGAFISLTLRFGLDFVVYSLRGQPLPNLVFAALAAALGGLLLPQRPGWRRALLLSVVILAAGFLLVLAVTAPSVYAGSQYPTGRAMMPARAVLLAVLAGLGALSGVSVRACFQRSERTLSLIFLFLTLAGAAYLGRTYAVPLAERTELAARAARWDARHAEISAQITSGSRDILTAQTDVVASLGDYGPDPADWINACAARYYQVNSITALP